MSIVLPMFGIFVWQEFKKFVRMGFVFALIIGAYWSLGALKQTAICSILGASCVPYARIFSMLGMLPLLMLYSKLLDICSRERVFTLMSGAYVISGGIFAWLFSQGYASTSVAYLFALFCDSYGSLLIALFWSIATDTTLPDSAKKGFPFVVALGQIGGIILPLMVTGISKIVQSKALTPLIIACMIPIIVSCFAMYRFLTMTPADLLRGYEGVQKAQATEQQKKPTFFEGLNLIRSHAYVAAIAVVTMFPDFLSVVFDMHFLLLAHQQYDTVELAQYLGIYGAAINGLTLFFLLCGGSTIVRYVGMSGALMILPCVILGALWGFAFFDYVHVLFGIMVYTKALTYAFNVPLVKQLYIPTTHEVRFKAQAWIDGFGLQGSKVTASLYNLLLRPLQIYAGELIGRTYHVLLSSSIGLMLVIIWLPVAYYLGKRYTQAIKQNKVVC